MELSSIWIFIAGFIGALGTFIGGACAAMAISGFRDVRQIKEENALSGWSRKLHALAVRDACAAVVFLILGFSAIVIGIAHV